MCESRQCDDDCPLRRLMSQAEYGIPGTGE
jgi:hypothetical protein